MILDYCIPLLLTDQIFCILRSGTRHFFTLELQVEVKFHYSHKTCPRNVGKSVPTASWTDQETNTQLCHNPSSLQPSCFPATDPSTTEDVKCTGTESTTMGMSMTLQPGGSTSPLGWIIPGFQFFSLRLFMYFKWNRSDFINLV